MLTREQQHYLKTVLRLKADAELQVFDGAGDRWQARTIADGRSLSIELLERLQQTPPPTPRRWLALAQIKAMEPALRKATELGATDLQPLVSERVQGPRQRDPDKQRRHWESIIESAAAQCHQDHLPTLHAPQDYNALLDDPPAAQLLMFDPSGDRWPAALPALDTVLIVGPEGGWTAPELARARERDIPVISLGPLVLRAETAPLAALVRLAASWEC